MTHPTPSANGPHRPRPPWPPPTGPASPAPAPLLPAARHSSRPPGTRDRGQATTEYALIMLAAALVALLVVAWATAGGGAGRIGSLFDRVVDSVLDQV